MKKVFVSMILAGSLLAGGTAYAQTQTDGTTRATTQNKAYSEEGEGKELKKEKHLMKGPNGGIPAPRAERQKFNPFEGVELTEDQQQKLQMLQQGLGPVQLSKEQQERIPENKNLTREERKQLQEEFQAKQIEVKKNYLNGVKEVLNPDQYVIFLENFYLYSPQEQGKEMKGSSPRVIQKNK